MNDLGDCDHCPVADVVKYRALIERIFDEYMACKRLGQRIDSSIHPGYLVALDVEMSAIQKREFERQQKAQKAKEMSSHASRRH